MVLSTALLSHHGLVDSEVADLQAMIYRLTTRNPRLTIERVKRILTHADIAVVRQRASGEADKLVGMATLVRKTKLDGTHGSIEDVYLPMSDAQEEINLRQALIECLLAQADSIRMRSVQIVGTVTEGIDMSKGTLAKMYEKLGFVERIDGALLSRVLPVPGAAKPLALVE